MVRTDFDAERAYDDEQFAARTVSESDGQPQGTAARRIAQACTSSSRLRNTVRYAWGISTELSLQMRVGCEVGTERLRTEVDIPSTSTSWVGSSVTV